MNRSTQLFGLGQSIWYDNIQRKILNNGDLQSWIEQGKIYGVTSNPTIFNNAISKSDDYDPAIQTMTWAGLNSQQIFDALSQEDIRRAAEMFLPVYQNTHGKDGYVSIEVNPYLCRDAEGTFKESKRLWNAIGMPNLMIKIPATKEGLTAVTDAIADGINVNVTLIFALQRYVEVIEAFLSGLEKRVAASQPVEGIASVASFFVSRVDTKIDGYLENLTGESSDPDKRKNLFGKAAIANAKLAYKLYQKYASSKRFKDLEKMGVKFQRPLWASTSTKNPNYRDVIYVEELIGKNTVNTVPPQTLDALLDHAEIKDKISKDIDQAENIFNQLLAIGINIEDVTKELEEEGLKSFSDAYTTCLNSIEKRRKEYLKQSGNLYGETQARLALLKDARFIERMFDQDASLWTEDSESQLEIQKRLGWLFLPKTSRDLVPEIYQFRDEIIADGYDTVALMGMGGSSLAPELYQVVFGRNNQLQLLVLDSTDPDQVRRISRQINPKKTMFIVSSKSGGTAEVNAFLAYFWERTRKSVKVDAGKHFAAITDPGTSLEKTALARNFRKIFFADPTVGGRYSALSIFGLLPAGLIGLDVNRILQEAEGMLNACKASVPAEQNPGLVLGSMLGQAALGGKNKLTLVCDPEFESFADWLEQLIAESSGKLGRGIVPIVREKPLPLENYGDDRIFVYLKSSGTKTSHIQRIIKRGFPALIYVIKDQYQLAAEFYRWEVATAVACAVIRVNAFDQPDVQDNKARTMRKIEEYQRDGKLQEPAAVWRDGNISIFASENIHLDDAKNLECILAKFLASAQKHDYVAINAYLPYDRAFTKVIDTLRVAISKKTNLATTRGFGPRFLHSTGQIHKGGANSGLFLQITTNPVKDAKFDNMTFGILERAQALGDFESLVARNRRILRIHLPQEEIVTVLDKLTRSLSD